MGAAEEHFEGLGLGGMGWLIKRARSTSFPISQPFSFS